MGSVKCPHGKNENRTEMSAIFLFFVSLASLKLLCLGKTQINLAFHSTFRNFDFVELTLHTEMKKKS